MTSPHGTSLMLSDHPHNYLRTRRKTLGLTQREMAAILGVSRSAITKAEGHKRTPPANLLILAELLFEQSPRELFPGQYEEIEAAAQARVIALLQTPSGAASHAAFRGVLVHLLARFSVNTTAPCHQPPLPFL